MNYIIGIIILLIICFVFLYLRITQTESFGYTPILILTKTGGIMGMSDTVEIYEDRMYVTSNKSGAQKKGNIDEPTWRSIQYLINNPPIKQNCPPLSGVDFFHYHLSINNKNIDIDEEEIKVGCISKQVIDAITNIDSLFIGT
jgi:hypothetical protein